MSDAISKLKIKEGIQWREILAVLYLLLFLLIALLGPSSGLLQQPNAINLNQVYQPPFWFTKIKPLHWLGTDELGRDVFANLVYGARTALQVSVPAMCFATVIGLFLGSLAGFWGNTGIRIRAASLIISLLLLFWAFYFSFYVRQANWLQAFSAGSGLVLQELGKTVCIFLTISLLAWLVSKIMLRVGFTKKLTLPVDQIILKIIEILGAVPRLLLVMCLTAFAQPNVLNLIILSTLTYWTGIARLIRGELLQVKELPFIEAATVAGLPDYRILLRHALPNTLSPVIVAFAFGLGSLMSLEATLSFLGVGIPPEVPSWGRMIKGIRQNDSAWWLLVFPALTLCCTILSVQTIAQYVIKRLYPQRKHPV